MCSTESDNDLRNLSNRHLERLVNQDIFLVETQPSLPHPFEKDCDTIKTLLENYSEGSFVEDKSQEEGL